MARSVDEIIEEEGSAKSKFQALDNDRGSVLTRARDSAALTIPSVLPDDGHTEEDDLETPYQGLGARLVNNLASKLLLALLPPNTSFFRILIDEDVKELARAQGKESEISEQEELAVAVEQEGLKQIEREALRVPSFEMFKSVIITGNALGYKLEKGLKTYRLDQYVIQRDFEGNPLEFIAKEQLNVESLPDDIRNSLDLDEDTLTVDIYTRAIKSEGRWVEYQEVEDLPVQGSEKEYDNDALPFIPLRWTSINGENYGRGLVEQYLGDFRSLEALYQLLVETSAVMARTIFGKKPGSTTDIDELNEASNGQCILGDLEEDITTLRVDKGADLNAPSQLIDVLTRRLEQAFLAASSVARDSERTTATEIRFMAADLEESLGGVYSVLALEFQLPLAKLILDQLDVDMQGADVVIITGVEALGRNNDLEKLRQFNGLIQELGSPELVLQSMNIDAYISDIANALGLDKDKYIKTPEQAQAEQEGTLEQQAASEATSAAVNQLSQQNQ